MLESEQQKQQTPELRDYLRVVRERLWIIVLAVVVVVGAAVVMATTSSPEYRATSKLLYQTNTLDRALFGSQIFSEGNDERKLETGVELIKTPAIAAAVKEQLGTELSAGALLGMVNVTSSLTTDILQIDAVSTDPVLAADVANAFAERFVVFRRNTDRETVAAARELVKEKLDTLSAEEASSNYGLMLKEKYESLQILEAMQNGGFTIVESATAPTQPFAPQMVRNGLLGLAVGLILGLGLAFLVNYFDKRIKDVKGLETAFSLPVLASVPAVSRAWNNGAGGKRSPGPVGFVSHPSLLESFRALRSSLQYFDGEKSIKTILITSGLPKEGKTVTSVNLALSLALAGKRVIILEADLRRPMVTRYLKQRNETGLSTILAGGINFADALQLVDIDSLVPMEVRDKGTQGIADVLEKSLFCLASGPLPPNPAELLSSARMEKLLEEFRVNSGIDYVIIDAPPVLSVADALVIAPKVDAIIIASRLNWTTYEEAEEVSDLLSRSGGRVIGVVAGGVKARGRGSYYHKRAYQTYYVR